MDQCFRSQIPTIGPRCRTRTSEIIDEWDARTRLLDDPAALQAEMDSTRKPVFTTDGLSIIRRYAFVPRTQDRLPISLRPSFTAVGGT